MDETRAYLTIGQKAKLHYINKKTLLWYDQIGLFSPEYTGENGYRYYTYDQCRQLEHILFLRQLGVGVEDIRRQKESARAADTLAFLGEQREKNQAHIRQLKEYDKVLRRKVADLREALSRQPGVVELRELPEQKFIISQPSSEGGKMWQFFSDTLAKVGVQHLYYYSFGAILDRADLLAGNLVRHRFFVEYRPEMKGVRPWVRPAGTYLLCCARDEEESLREAYGDILAYAGEHGLEVVGDAFERQLVDQFSTSERGEFLVEVGVPVRKME